MGGWCADVFEDMLEELGAYDEEEEFELRPVDYKVLRDFFRGSKFSPFLTALDKDTARVAKREERKIAVNTFKEYRREMGLRELTRWIDEDKVFDEDEYNLYNNPTLPMRYGDWLDLIEVADKKRLPMTDDETSESEGRVRKLASAVVALTSYATNLHWKIDHLLHHTVTPPVTGTRAIHEQLLVKYPFLVRCDDHVAQVVPHEDPIELGRTSKVCTRTYTRTYTDTEIYTYNIDIHTHIHRHRNIPIPYISS